jgi:hypothetical protein
LVEGQWNVVCDIGVGAVLPLRDAAWSACSLRVNAEARFDFEDLQSLDVGGGCPAQKGVCNFFDGVFVFVLFESLGVMQHVICGV